MHRYLCPLKLSQLIRCLSGIAVQPFGFIHGRSFLLEFQFAGKFGPWTANPAAVDISILKSTNIFKILKESSGRKATVPAYPHSLNIAEGCL